MIVIEKNYRELAQETGELRERLRLVAIAVRTLALGVTDRLLAQELERTAELAEKGSK